MADVQACMPIVFLLQRARNGNKTSRVLLKFEFQLFEAKKNSFAILKQTRDLDAESGECKSASETVYTD